MKKICLLLVAAMLSATVGCGKNQAAVEGSTVGDSDSVPIAGESLSFPPNEEAEYPPNDILTDKLYRNGFKITGDGQPSNPTYLGNFNYPERQGVTPQWILTQWATKYMILPTDMPKKENDCYVWRDESKVIKVDTTYGEIYLECNASKEYDDPRAYMEEWPHLLIEQYITSRCPDLSSIGSLRVQIEFSIDKCDRMMTDEEYVPTLHSAQFLMNFTLSNLNKESKGYGDTIWFGLAFYDYRFTYSEEGIAIDDGKESATGIAKYGISSKKFLPEPVCIGDKVFVDFDVLPEIANALKLAQEYEALEVFRDTEVKDLKFTTMNLGWEIPGTFDVASTIYQLGLVWEN